MHPVFRDLVLARVAMMMNTAAAVKGLQSPTVKGTLREIVIRQLLAPMLPADVGLATGIVVDHDGGASVSGRDSSQIDVVMFDRRILPPALYEGTGVFTGRVCSLRNRGQEQALS